MKFRITVMLAAALAAAPAIAQPAIDYAREDRWAQEIVPSIVVGDAVWLVTPARAKVLAILTEPVRVPKGGVIVIHGLGVHPDFGMIGAVRADLADAGYVTLSVQMPVLAADAPREDYAATFPEAAERIAAAVRMLRERKLAPIALVSHSMGAVMADAYVARPGSAAIDAWIPLGMLVPPTARPAVPVLDDMAARDFPQVKDEAPARRKALPRDACSAQVTIAGNDHYFERGEAALAAMITRFVERAFADRC
jgi:dienelactone hydrolase